MDAQRLFQGRGGGCVCAGVWRGGDCGRGQAAGVCGDLYERGGWGANGEGIYLFEFDTRTGALAGGKLVAKTPNPSWIVIHPSKKYLYAINEVTDYEGGSGSVSAFAMDEASGELTLINTVSSEGAGPAHMSLDRTGKFALVANYAGGTIAVLPIEADGRLGAAVDVHRDADSLGKKLATDAPRGSFAISGHDKPACAHDCAGSNEQVCAGNGPCAGPDLCLSI